MLHKLLVKFSINYCQTLQIEQVGIHGVLSATVKTEGEEPKGGMSLRLCARKKHPSVAEQISGAGSGSTLRLVSRIPFST